MINKIINQTLIFIMNDYNVEGNRASKAATDTTSAHFFIID